MCQTDVEHAVSQVTWGEQRAQTSTMNTFLITDTHIWREWEWYRYWKQEEWLSVFIVKCFQVVYGLGFNHIPDSGSLHRTLTSSLTGSDERLIADIGRLVGGLVKLVIGVRAALIRRILVITGQTAVHAQVVCAHGRQVWHTVIVEIQVLLSPIQLKSKTNTSQRPDDGPFTCQSRLAML